MGEVATGTAERVLTINEIAERLSISKRTLFRMRAAGDPLFSRFCTEVTVASEKRYLDRVADYLQHLVNERVGLDFPCRGEEVSK